MPTDEPLRDEEIQWLNTYEKNVHEFFRTRFESSSDRFEAPYPLLKRFTSSVDAVKVKANGRSRFSAVDEAHNELCIASAILENQGPQFNCIKYEPRLSGCPQSIDFLATSSALKVYVDVKTIKPVATDRWEQYMKAQTEEWMPDNVKLMLEKESRGGELWHNRFAARSGILQYSLELEKKIAESNIMENNTLVVLALCGDGFSWRQDELEDFVAYYYTGTHRTDDPFSLAESRAIQDKQIVIRKSISRFACMQRPQGDVLQTRLTWDVQPPRFPNLS